MIMGAALTQWMIIVRSQPVEQLCNKGHIKTKRGAWLAVHLDQTGLEILSPQGPAQQGGVNFCDSQGASKASWRAICVQAEVCNNSVVTASCCVD